jgi:hypothetical protein
MAMQMQRAFNSKFLTRITQYKIVEGSYDVNNTWVEGAVTSQNIWGVIKTGNQHSKMEAGEALHTDDGGERYSDFKTLFVTDKYNLEVTDKIAYKGKYFNVLSRADEETYGFYSVLIEKTLEWTP